ncbi:MAG TPA: tail fiber protein [Thermoanaerobaculia bacterium]|nr:tail fiber protein [Thermoanaerobaculia bacterium]
MSEPFLSEIKIMSFGFPPKGWALCDGQLMPINQNQALFSLLGTTYGGDGRVNFGLPNLQGRTPMHMGQGHTLGERGGEQNHTLSISEIPTHVHTENASLETTNNLVDPVANNILASPAVQVYCSTATNLTSMLPATIANVGGSQPHPNMQPNLTLSFCIALTGIFPTQN